MSEEEELTGKLARTWHLNVPERRRLPAGTVRASLLLDAIEEELRSRGMYPPNVTLDDDFRGGLIELTAEGICRIHWKTQVSTSQYELGPSSECQSPREAAATLLRALFPAGIDGIPIDWQA
jgi:hypothetical protein